MQSFTVELSQFLAAMESEVAQRWPELAPLLQREPFSRHLVELNVMDELAQLSGSELALAFLCDAGAAPAIARFEREYLARVRERLRRVDSADSFLDEVLQRIRERLLVRDEGRTRMADYAGRGSLLGWVQIAALRLALNHRRDQKMHRQVNADDFDLIGPTDDPVILLIKQRHQADFKVAFGEAVAALSADDVDLLRLYFVDELTLSQIGQLEGIDKSNVSRRLRQVREALFGDTRRRLQARLGLSAGELDSLMNVIQSQLHLSLERMLGRGDS